MKNHMITLKRIERKKLITEVFSQLPSGNKMPQKYVILVSRLSGFWHRCLRCQAKRKLEGNHCAVWPPLRLQKWISALFPPACDCVLYLLSKELRARPEAGVHLRGAHVRTRSPIFYRHISSNICFFSITRGDWCTLVSITARSKDQQKHLLLRFTSYR